MSSKIKEFVTVVIPTYNEKGNIKKLVNAIYKLNKFKYIKRIIFVDDDSDDDTSEYIKKTPFPLDVICIHRINSKGLSSAIIDGILATDTDYIAVMDADNQHDPADLFEMINQVKKNSIDLVIGSRFKEFRYIESLSEFRNKISFFGNTVLNKIIKKEISDPLSGFFIVKRSLIMSKIKSFHPTGFKILFEILYIFKDIEISIVEKQINFKKRHYGKSKLNLSIIFEFIEQIINKFLNGYLPEGFLSFILVGTFGIIVHMFFLYFFLFALEKTFYLAYLIATLIAMTSNFWLNNMITFKKYQIYGKHWFFGLIKFMVVCGIGTLSNIGIANVLFYNQYTWWLSAAAGIFVGVVFNYNVSKNFVWNKR